MNDLLRRLLFLPRQASTMAAQVDGLHYFVIGVTMLGAGAITAVGLLFLVRYRSRGEAFAREDPTARPPLWAEIGVVSFLLGLFCLWWVLGFMQYMRIETPPPSIALTVHVTGKQWMWKFAYPTGVSTISTLVVPVGENVQLVMTSRDVIHSFYIPEFRTKQDVLPGRYTSTWFNVRMPGVYQVFCAEYCGVSHSLMRAQVVALSGEDFARWLSAPTPVVTSTGPHVLPVDSTASRAGAGTALAATNSGEGVSVEDFPPAEPLDLVRVGEVVAAQQGCLRCHTLDGTPHIGPTWAGLFGSRIAVQGGGAVVADGAYLTQSMMDPAAVIHAGFPAVMPSYQGLLSAAEVGALVELIQSLRDIAPVERTLPGAPATQEGLPAPGVTSQPLPTGIIRATATPDGGTAVPNWKAPPP